MYIHLLPSQTCKVNTIDENGQFRNFADIFDEKASKYPYVDCSCMPTYPDSSYHILRATWKYLRNTLGSLWGITNLRSKARGRIKTVYRSQRASIIDNLVNSLVKVVHQILAWHHSFWLLKNQTIFKEKDVPLDRTFPST